MINTTELESVTKKNLGSFYSTDAHNWTAILRYINSAVRYLVERKNFKFNKYTYQLTTDFNNTEYDIPYQIETFFVLNNARRLSLSYARNIALRYICENDIMFNYIMFPDDDSSFDSAFFENYGKFVNGNTVIDVYCKNEKILFKPNNYDGGMLLMKGNYDAAMSVNMIIQRDTVNNVGLFDERMGVGSKYGSCEDSDYFIRCCEYSKHGFLYEKNLWNFHPKADDKYKNMRLSTLMRRYKNYGKGIIFLFDKHNMHVDAVKCVFSALAGSLFSLLRLNFKLAIARIFAFFVRGLFFINLLLKKNDSR